MTHCENRLKLSPKAIFLIEREKMVVFKKVAIVGVGLIGGSIGLDIKNKHLANEVIGVSQHKKTLFLARKRGAIDKGSLSLNIVKDADLLILATPVTKIIELAKIISKIVKPQCIVTDVGSTKRELVASLEASFPNFVGAHPLAGSEKRGILNAEPDMFKDTLVLLTPTRNTRHKALNEIRRLWGQLGARTVSLTPFAHDKILSFVSHLPHIAAFSLLGIIPAKYLRFSSSGLKDTTRIAGSDSQLWVDIFLSNQKNIIRAIELLEGQLSVIKSAIQRKDKELLLRILEKAKAKRENLG